MLLLRPLLEESLRSVVKMHSIDYLILCITIFFFMIFNKNANFLILKAWENVHWSRCSFSECVRKALSLSPILCCWVTLLQVDRLCVKNTSASYQRCKLPLLTTEKEPRAGRTVAGQSLCTCQKPPAHRQPNVQLPASAGPGLTTWISVAWNIEYE